MSRQLDLFARKKRKRRRGVRWGRPVKPGREGFVPHLTREKHLARLPVHVSMKRVYAAPSLRSQRVFAAILQEIAAAVRRGVRVVHYSVQHDHMHLLVEAEDRQALIRGLQRLFSRIAFAVNRVSLRSGSLFRDRHHRRALWTPTEVRAALAYVLFNERKHVVTSAGVTLSALEAVGDSLDECSSAHWFVDWDPRARPPPPRAGALLAKHGPSPLAPARTWLLTDGWLRAEKGALRFDEMPGLPI